MTRSNRLIQTTNRAPTPKSPGPLQHPKFLMDSHSPLARLLPVFHIPCHLHHPYPSTTTP